MSQTSLIHSLPYIQEGQAQKHVTHNEALRYLDVVTQLTVQSQAQTTPPATPAPGDRFIVAPASTGAWAGQDGTIALWDQNLWQFTAPLPGWVAHVLDQNTLLGFDGTTWAPLDMGLDDLQNLPAVGIGTTASAPNALSVAADSTLFTHAGDDHRLVLNKATPPDTTSLVYQTGWTGHAEMGLTGSDDFSVKVSADGTTWLTGLEIDRTTGAVSLPNTPPQVTYDAGNWTPRLTFGGNDTGMVHRPGWGFGKYFRINDTVTVQAAVVLDAKGTSTGPALVEDLPFVASGTALYFPGVLVPIGGCAGLSGAGARIIPDGKAQLYNTTATGFSPLTDANFTDGSNFKFTLQYALT